MTHSVSREDVARIIEDVIARLMVSDWETVRDEATAAILSLTVPEGYRLVPVEPTETMIEAANHDHATNGPCESPFGPEGFFASAYRAMLSALPEVGGGSVPSGALSVVWEIIAARKAVYVQKALQHDYLAEDTLNEREKFDHTVEAFAWLEAELSKALTTPPPTTPDALSAGLDAEPSAGWRGIESAPKDRFVLLYTPARDEMNGFVAMAKWQGMGDGSGGSWYGIDEDGLTFNPLRGWDYTTHWMPLPASPLPPPPAVVESAK